MSVTVKLPCVRFVKRVSSGGSFSKYGYIGMMQRNGEELKTVPWQEAATAGDDVTLTTNQLTKTDGVALENGTWEKPPSYTAYTGDMYDAFCQAGDAVARNGTMCGYAGCVAYRFTLPVSSSANALQEVSLALQRDRYLRSGVRVSAALSNYATPNPGWITIRGESPGCARSSSTVAGEGVVGVTSFGFLGQPDVVCLTDSVSASGTLTLDTATTFANAHQYKYLYIYVSIEDYAAYWNLYKENVTRQYYIEGSAMLVSGSCLFTFASATAASTDTDEITVASGFSGAVDHDLAYDTSSLSDCSISYINGVPRDADPDGSPLLDVSKNQAPQNLLAAVRQVYAMCHAGQTRSPSSYADTSEGVSLISSKLVDDGVPGASFCVCVNPNVSRTNSPKRTGCVILSRRVALHRFVIPFGFKPSSVRFSWVPVITSGMVRLSAWMRVGTGFVDYSDRGIRDIRLFTASDDVCGEWRRLTTFINGGSYQTDGTKSLSAPFPSSVKAGSILTVLLTAYAEQVTSSFSNGNVIGMRKDLSGNDIVSTIVATAGWRPSITLVK